MGIQLKGLAKHLEKLNVGGNYFKNAYRQTTSCDKCANKLRNATATTRATRATQATMATIRRTKRPATRAGRDGQQKQQQKHQAGH